MQRGPLVYCLEQLDQEDKASLFDLALSASSAPNNGFTSEFRSDLLGGVVLLQHKGVAASKPNSEEPLYRTLESTSRGETQEVNLTFVPYYAWGNRLPGAMVVWIPYASGGQLAGTKGRAATRTHAGTTQ